MYIIKSRNHRYGRVVGHYEVLLTFIVYSLHTERQMNEEKKQFCVIVAHLLLCYTQINLL